jgi:glyoxylase-like metal-dependent hydrolase (beta-lactamase superfamily II)
MDLTRRTFLRDMGQGTLAVAILGIGIVSCSSDEGVDGVGSTTNGDPAPEDAVTTSTRRAPTTTSDGMHAAPLTWEQVVLGGVSAYVLVRAGEAAVVDTGNPGDAGDIAATLAGLGIGWSDVSHVILTHLHRDHVGSLGDVMAEAPDAAGFAGAPDIPSIPSPRTLTPVGDGDNVFGLDIIATPGHTPGSIAVHDPESSLLVAGDALQGGGGGGVIGANPRFTDDMALANESVKKLSARQFDTVVFGHGDPVVGGASEQVAALAATL